MVYNLIFYLFLLCLARITRVSSEWIEIPQVKPTQSVLRQSNVFTNSDLLKRYTPVTHANGFVEGTKLNKVTAILGSDKIDVIGAPSVIHLTKELSVRNLSHIASSTGIPVLGSLDYSLMKNGAILHKSDVTPITVVPNFYDTSRETVSHINQPQNIQSHESEIEDDDDDDSVTIEDDEDVPDVSDENSREDEYEEPTTTKKPKLKTPKIFRLVPMPTPKSPPLGIFEFIKEIQKSFFSKTVNGIQDKIKILSSFKDELMGNIENRLKYLWPSKVIKSKRKRSIMSHGDSHMDFPSAEGALITICFLTFAVFLIKLVLQVINTIKSKHYSYNGFDQTSMAAVKVMKKHRNARRLSNTEEDVENFVKVIKSIENHNQFT